MSEQDQERGKREQFQVDPQEVVKALGTDDPMEALRRIAELLAVAKTAIADFAARGFNSELDRALWLVGRWLPKA